MLSAVKIAPQAGAVCRASAPRRSSQTLRSRVVVRATQEAEPQPQAVAEQAPLEAQPAVAAATPAAPAAAAVAAEPFSLLGASQEAINGRAAMLGFIIAIATELTTQQSVWSQIAGKYVDRELVERPIGASTLFFGFVVVMTSLATIFPQLDGQGLTSRSIGPFTPEAESRNGRAAMIGFAALLLVELVRGNTALF